MKIFISQPMNGIPQEQIEKRRNEIIKMIKGKYLNNIEFIDLIIDQKPDEDVFYSPVWYLAKSIEKLSTVTMVYFDKGWEKARGCQIEYSICRAYGIPTISWKDF